MCPLNTLNRSNPLDPLTSGGPLTSLNPLAPLTPLRGAVETVKFVQSR